MNVFLTLWNACVTVCVRVRKEPSFGGPMAEILKLENNPLAYVLEYAVRLILCGKVVAIPTDTIYGLAADPFNLAAISEIFRIKRRTADRPLPLLVDSLEQAVDLANHPPELFFKLASQFWPYGITYPMRIVGLTRDLRLWRDLYKRGSTIAES